MITRMLLMYSSDLALRCRHNGQTIQRNRPGRPLAGARWAMTARPCGGSTAVAASQPAGPQVSAVR